LEGGFGPPPFFPFHWANMHLIEKSTITVSEDRQRQTFNPATIRDLADSILRNGLIHPLTVESLDNPRLRAGERRLRALNLITVPYRHNGRVLLPHIVPVLITGELTEEQREELELEENIQREDLTWHEKQSALARLHALRSAQAEKVGEKQTFTATAREVAKVGPEELPPASVTLAVRNATLLQPFLDDPEIKGAKNEKEALSLVRKRLTREFNLKLAKSFDATRGNNPHVLTQGDCRVVLPQLEANQFDVIIADPPYGIDAHKLTPLSGSNSGQTHEYDDTLEYASTVWDAIFNEGFRVCKPNAHLYLFCDIRRWDDLCVIASQRGWRPWPWPIVWVKPGGGMLGDSTRGPRRSYELILFAYKGDKRVTGVYLDTIIEAPTSTSLHAAAKPVDLYINLLRRSCVPGDKVLDPTAGSGPVFPAANKLRLTAHGIENVEMHYATALRRMNESADV